MEKILIDVGEHMTVEIVAETIQILVEKSSFWSTLPRVCPLCGAAVALTYRSPQGNDYYGMKCKGTPAHETTFGEFKEKTKGLYYKENAAWTVAYGYKPPEESEAPVPAPRVADPVPTGRSEDLDRMIKEEWGKAERKVTYETAVFSKFQKMPEDLSIDDKTRILASLRGEMMLAGAAV